MKTANFLIDSCGNQVFQGDVVVTHQRGYHHFCYAIVERITISRVFLVLCGKILDEALEGINGSLHDYYLTLPRSYRSPLNVAKVVNWDGLSSQAQKDILRGKDFVKGVYK